MDIIMPGPGKKSVTVRVHPHYISCRSSDHIFKIPPLNTSEQVVLEPSAKFAVRKDSIRETRITTYTP